MNNIKIKTTAAIVALLAAGSCSLLGFGLPKIGKSEEGAAASSLSADDVLAESDGIFGQLASATIELLTGQAFAAEALGLKEESEKLITAAEALSKGDAEEEIKKSKNVSEAADQAIKAKMEEASELSAEQKEAFAKSLVHFGKGVYLEKEMVESVTKTAKNAKSLIDSSGAMEKMKLGNKFKPIISLAGSLPGDIKTAVSTLQMYTNFAKNNDIEIPKDATAALGDDF